MYPVISIPRLDEAIQGVLDNVEHITDYTHSFQVEVINNAGGIIPTYLWEYHTVADCIRHGSKITGQFLLGGRLYGTDSFNRLVDLLTDQQLDSRLSTIIQNNGNWVWSPSSTAPNPRHFSHFEPIEDKIREYMIYRASLSPFQLTTRVRDWSLTGDITERGYYDFVSLASNEAGEPVETPMVGGNSANLTIHGKPLGFIIHGSFVPWDSLRAKWSLYGVLEQTPSVRQATPEGSFRSFGRSCFFFNNEGDLIRAIRLDEPYFYTQNSQNQWNAFTKTKRNSAADYLFPGTAFYSSPNIYLCLPDRTVIYYVD